MSEITGAEQLKAKLKALGPELAVERGGRALYQEATIIMNEAIERTPLEFNALRSSYELGEPIKEPDGNVSVTIMVGGPSAPYAVYVHEILWYHHPHGEAKFLERTLEDNIGSLPGRIAARIEL